MKKNLEISKHVYLAFLVMIITLSTLESFFPDYAGFIKYLTNLLTGVFLTLILLRIQINKNPDKPIEISKYVYHCFFITVIGLLALESIMPAYTDFFKNLNSMLAGLYISLIILRRQGFQNLNHSNA